MTDMNKCQTWLTCVQRTHKCCDLNTPHCYTLSHANNNSMVEDKILIWHWSTQKMAWARESKKNSRYTKPLCPRLPEVFVRAIIVYSPLGGSMQEEEAGANGFKANRIAHRLNRCLNVALTWSRSIWEEWTCIGDTTCYLYVVCSLLHPLQFGIPHKSYPHMVSRMLSL